MSRSASKQPRHFLQQARIRAIPYLSYARSLLRSQRQIIRIWPEQRVELGENVALFTHFDRRGQLADHVVAYVRALHRSGFAVVFISNTGRQLQADLAMLEPFCRLIITRRNIGYDFGAIRELLFMLDLPRLETERLLIVNDSVYGPLVPIKDILSKADLDEADVWGLTESWQHRYHLQSYFLLVGRRAMTHPAWQKFWENVRQVSCKQWVVHRYEIGLTQKLLRAGLRCRSIWPYHELLDHVVRSSPADEAAGNTGDPLKQMRILADQRLRQAIARRVPLNPTSDLWRQLLIAGFPFLKVELLRKNPTAVPDVADWRSVVAQVTNADCRTIERDLQQRMYNHSP